MPLAVFLALETNPPAAIALSLVLLAVSVAVLAAVGARVLGAGRPRETRLEPRPS
jgi:molybdate transport system permease protein